MKRTIVYFVTLFLFNLMNINYAHSDSMQPITAKDIEVSFILDYATEADFSAHMTIHNKSAMELKNWMLGFTFIRVPDSVTGATLVKQIGDYYLISGDEKNKNLPANGSTSFTMTGKYTIRNDDDAPTGYFMLFNDSNGKKIVLNHLASKFIMISKKTTTAKMEYDNNNKKNNTAIEGNAINPAATTTPTITVIPAPVSINMKKGHFILKPDTIIYTEGNHAETTSIANYLADIIQPATGYKLSIKQLNSNTATATQNAIVLTTQGATSDLGSEGYNLNVDTQQIMIKANTDAGLFYGIQTLRQLFPPPFFSKTLQTNVQWIIPNVSINDFPRFAYRGVLLDVARHFFDVDQIKKLLDLMAIVKLNYFHWHLTDDEGWRIEIKKYPELTKIGAWRGYDEVIPPALGSGFNRYGGFYTQDQIRDIVNYAKARNITIIPEIDLPAHSRALIYSLPEQLLDKEDKSIYSGPRGFHDNVLSPCLPATYEVVENILSEVIDLFPSNYIHIGSDERPSGAWEKSPSCQALMKKMRFKDTHELQNYFSKKIQTFLTSKNKSLAGWEEIMEGGSLATTPTPLIYAWLGMNGEKTAAQQGYDVILTPYQYLYLELAYDPDSHEMGDYWGGYVDTFKVYSYTPIPPQMTAEQKSRIKGIEGGLWTEYIDTQDRLEYLAFPKMAALAEVAWTTPSKRNWKDFSQRVGQYYLPLLDSYGVLYRLSPPGFTFSSGLLNANVEFPGLILKYTLDNTTPTINSKTYTKPEKVNAATGVVFRSFDTKGRGSKESK